MAVNKYCDNCVYCTRLTDNALGCCTYLLKTDKRRPCPPGEGCTVKVARKVYRRRKKNADN